jgi:DNA-binding MarR family transcriptional regulator
MSEVKHKTIPATEAYRIGDLLHSAAIHLLRKVRAQDRRAGIGPAQLSALSVLVFSGPRSLKELAHAEQVRPPTMSRIAAGLVRAGLIRRKATDDKRSMRLEATAKGVKTLQEGRRRRVALLAQALQTLPESELREARALAQFMQKLVGKL